MELLQLKYFFESAQNQNFAKTAEKYMVPTSSVSASVKRLENELGCKLFDRSSNRIILNSNGKRLKQSLYYIFSELDKVIEDLTQEKNDTREIKMLVRAMRSVITDYIIEYNTENPHIVFKTVFDFTNDEYEKYDIIIDEKSDNYPGYENFELFDMKLRVKASSKSPLCGKKLTLKQLSDQAFISLGEQSNTHKILIRACNKAGFTPNIVVSSNDIKCFEKLIESGIGLGITRETIRVSHSDAISPLDVSDFDERYTVCAYYKEQAAYGNVKHFMEFLKRQTM